MTGRQVAPAVAEPGAPPSPAPRRRHRHGSAVGWCGRGILLLGPSGAGKSALANGLLLAGGYLVADDLVTLRRRGASLLAAGVAPRGLIELRGNGIFRLATTSEVPVNLCVEFAGAGGAAACAAAAERLPERRTTVIDGVSLPVLRVGTGRGAAAVAAVLTALFARRAA